jgi:hypothetical protein
MRSFQLVENKVYETDFFLDKIKSCTDMIECSYYFSAFLASSRSITFSLQACMKGADGFDEWYETAQNILKESNLAKKFVDLRNESQKVGLIGISSWKHYRDKNGNDVSKFYFRSLNDNCHKKSSFYQWAIESIFNRYFCNNLEDDVAIQCERYFIILINIIYDCLNQFGNIIDPEKYYTLENIAKQGLTIEDIEEMLGYPRGYTDINGIDDEKRIELIRRDEAWSEIDYIFQKYVNKSRYND